MAYLFLFLGILLSAAPLYASSPEEGEEVAVPDYDVINELFFGRRHLGRHKRQAGSGMAPATTEGSGILAGEPEVM